MVYLSSSAQFLTGRLIDVLVVRDDFWGGILFNFHFATRPETASIFK
ncbi:hypothetical protein THF1D04_360012 [Vibrio owensii]|uniref:Uncharacterized protein n=1 Tax=Vibrio owensii TaxID=696485 RepID=A0AAU9Q8Z4_9VIBR|nr:hypothetical protein THF1D04_360012 [Vibrio owensii]